MRWNMSSYNSIEKIKYTDSLSDAVSLDEYIVFGNEKREEKYVVFRLSNNVDQKLLGMKLEVNQYDMHDRLIEKSVVIYNNFLAKANSSFVPKAKLKVQYACKRISVTLLQAAFDRVLWNEGEYVDNTYKFEHYVRDEKYIKETERPRVMPAPVVRTMTNTERRELSERFRVRTITKKNIALFPAVYYWITCILLVLAIGITVFLFPRYSKIFTLEGYDLQALSAEEVKICGYEGSGDALVVPEKIGNYRVVKIGEGAFSRLSVKTIVLPSGITAIEAGAFKNLKELRSIASVAEHVTIEAYAFDGLEKLTTFEMSGAVLVKNSLHGCRFLTGIQFASTDVEKFTDLFGETSHGAKVKYFIGNYTHAKIFFDGVEIAE